MDFKNFLTEQAGLSSKAQQLINKYGIECMKAGEENSATSADDSAIKAQTTKMEAAEKDLQKYIYELEAQAGRAHRRGVS